MYESKRTKTKKALSPPMPVAKMTARRYAGDGYYIPSHNPGDEPHEMASLRGHAVVLMPSQDGDPQRIPLDERQVAAFRELQQEKPDAIRRLPVAAVRFKRALLLTSSEDGKVEISALHPLVLYVASEEFEDKPSVVVPGPTGKFLGDDVESEVMQLTRSQAGAYHEIMLASARYALSRMAGEHSAAKAALDNSDIHAAITALREEGVLEGKNIFTDDQLKHRHGCDNIIHGDDASFAKLDVLMVSMPDGEKRQIGLPDATGLGIIDEGSLFIGVGQSYTLRRMGADEVAEVREMTNGSFEPEWLLTVDPGAYIEGGDDRVIAVVGAASMMLKSGATIRRVKAWLPEEIAIQSGMATYERMDGQPDVPTQEAATKEVVSTEVVGAH